MGRMDKPKEKGIKAGDLDSTTGWPTPPDDMLRRQAALINLSYEPIFAWDLETGITDWNTGAEKLYGYSKFEAIGRQSHLLLKTRHPIPLKRLIKTLETDGYWSGELSHTTKDGRTVVVESRHQLVESNGMRLVLESNRDITERKVSDEISERYRLLWNNSSDIIWFIQPDGSFVDVNQTAIDVYGFSREEFRSMNVGDLRHPSSIAAFQQQLEIARLQGIHFETLHVRKDGTAFPVEVQANGADFGDEQLVMAIVRDISERKKSEAALRESEERRQLAQQAGNVGVFDWNIATGRTYWSETMWSFYGGRSVDRDPDEEYWSTLLHVNDRERVMQNFREALESASDDFQDEFRISGKDGSIRWVTAAAKILRDEAGTATRMYGVNIDITQRKEAEERIRYSENQLRLVTSAVPALISYVGRDERYKFVNEKFGEWFGLPTSAIVGKRVCDFFSVADYRKIKPRIDQALAGQLMTFESKLDLRVMGERYVHISYVPDVGIDGSVHGYYGLTHDLTELKRSQEQLRSSEERMSLLTDSFTDHAIFSIDCDGLIESWNTGAETIFGYTPNQALGKSCEIVFTKEDVALGIPAKEMKTARAKGRASDDRWLLRKDGTRFFANGVMVPLYAGGSHTGYAKIVSDLTEKQRRAEELQRAHDELEIRVNERTQELADANIALLQEMEERKAAEGQRVELLQRLVTGQESERRRIARDLHDQLGQRLTALRLKIASLSEFAIEDDRFSARVKRLQVIAERLDSEVSFLAWELRPMALDDLGLVDAIRAFVNEWSRHHEIPAYFHSSKDSIDGLGHESETHLYRITQEALNNILKYARAKQVTVLLEKRGSEVILIVEDDGLGFDPAEKSHSESRKGLGLVGMQERAVLVDGNVEIESAPGAGTTIYVRIPVLT